MKFMINIQLSVMFRWTDVVDLVVKVNGKKKENIC